ncbi:MAG: hypothetical protein OXI54_07510 [Chloroflexota bacterium]|nr:hypothetical protein [Chloroflexota bacterium]
MLEGARQWVGDFASDWAGPIGLGLATAAVIWIVWHFTKPGCTMMAAANGLCNPGIVARYITVEILLQSGGAALAVGALKGGYDKIMMRRMLNEEREARQLAEQQLASERKRVDETIQMVAELVNEFREERRNNAATQQALLDTIVRLTEQSNGRRQDPPEN